MKPLAVLITLLGIASCVQSAPPAIPDAPAAPATAPATTTAATSPAVDVDAILIKLHDAGVNLKSFSANVALHETDPASGEPKISSGTVVYEVKPDGSARIHVVFDKIQEGDNIYSDRKKEYLLDNGAFTERDYRHTTQIIHPLKDADKKVNVLKLGEGPFPLPIGQDPNEVKAKFTVDSIAPAQEDPPDTDHVRLSPKPDNEQFVHKFKFIDVWVRKTDPFPVHVVTTAVNPDDPTLSGEVKVTDLSNLDTRTPLKDSDFDLPPIPDSWQRQVTTPGN